MSTAKWYLAQQVKHQLPALTTMIEQRMQELQDVRERLQAAMTQRQADTKCGGGLRWNLAPSQ
jgi:hypothetical protein